MRCSRCHLAHLGLPPLQFLLSYPAVLHPSEDAVRLHSPPSVRMHAVDAGMEAEAADDVTGNVAENVIGDAADGAAPQGRASRRLANSFPSAGYSQGDVVDTSRTCLEAGFVVVDLAEKHSVGRHSIQECSRSTSTRAKVYRTAKVGGRVRQGGWVGISTRRRSLVDNDAGWSSSGGCRQREFRARNKVLVNSRARQYTGEHGSRLCFHCYPILEKSADLDLVEAARMSRSQVHPSSAVIAGQCCRQRPLPRQTTVLQPDKENAAPASELPLQTTSLHSCHHLPAWLPQRPPWETFHHVSAARYVSQSSFSLLLLFDRYM